MIWKTRLLWLNLKWWVYWRVIEALGLEEWADQRWYQRYENSKEYWWIGKADDKHPTPS
jgi:hypothetical protein